MAGWDTNSTVGSNPIIHESNPRFEKSKTEINPILYLNEGNAPPPSRMTLSAPIATPETSRIAQRSLLVVFFKSKSSEIGSLKEISFEAGKSPKFDSFDQPND